MAFRLIGWCAVQALIVSCSSAPAGDVMTSANVPYTLESGAPCAPGSPPPGTFTESAAALGIDFVHDDRAPWEGDPDIIRDFGGVGVADLDRDGHLDLYFANSGAPDRIYLTEGRGPAKYSSHERSGETVSSSVVALADIDGDGHLDALLHEFESYWVRGDGSGGFGPPQPMPPYVGRVDDDENALEVELYGYAVGDVNGDGWLDVYAGIHLEMRDGDWWPGREWLFLNNGGELLDASGFIPGQEVEDRTFMVALDDLDRDGDLDLVEINDAWSLHQQGLGGDKEVQGNRVWRHEGVNPDGTFTFADVTDSSGARLDVSAMGAAMGDYDNDGWTDMYVTAMLPHTNTLLRNTGAMTFEDVTYDANAYTLDFGIHDVGWGAVFVDVDSDGWQDLYVLHGWHTTDDFSSGIPANPDTQANVLLSNRQGVFEPASDDTGLGGTGRSRSPVLGDLDRNGFVDIVVGNALGAPYVYLNGCDNRPWLTVRIERQDGPNRFGIGERITVTGGGLTQTRILRSAGDGLYGSSAPEAYFGFPPGTETVDVEAGGDVIRDVPVRRLLTVGRSAPLAGR